MGIDKKKEIKMTNIIHDVAKNKNQYAIKQQSLIKEEYTKQTLQGLYDRMYKELQNNKRDIQTYKDLNIRYNRNFEKERLNETGIKENVNKIYNKGHSQEIVTFYFVY